MKAQTAYKTEAGGVKGSPGNIIPLTNHKPEKPKSKEARQRFRVIEYTNPRTQSTSWCVTGTKRNGERVRQNFVELVDAQALQQELNTEYLKGHTETGIKATRLTGDQVALAEAAFLRLGADDELTLAVDHWLQHGRQAHIIDSPALTEASEKFKTWLETSEMRELSRVNLRRRVGIFVNSVPNLPVSDFTPEAIDSYLASRNVSAKSKDNDRRAVSRFFSWCMERPRRWAKANPCRKERARRVGESKTPGILTLAQCEAIMFEAEAHKEGRIAHYVAACLFGGLRPYEAQRLTWDKVNLKDREIRLEPWMTKTKTGRVVSMCDTLHAWLSRYEGQAFYPENWRRDFDTIKIAAGLVRVEGDRSKSKVDKVKKGRLVKAYRYWKRLTPINWAPDIMRHTAISHYFRNTGSYGKAAEQFGNSESIIKKHYQSRVSSDDTKAFYSILPKKG